MATSGAYADLAGKPALGTASAQNINFFATAAQGVKADTALQSVDFSPYETIAKTERALSSSATLLPSDEIVECTGTFTVTLPALSAVPAGKKYTVANIGNGIITMATTSNQRIGQDISGAISLVGGETLTIRRGVTLWIVE